MSQAIKYIVDSDKPYPSWIKNHRVFKSLSKIDKVWPSIGLQNFSKNIDVLSTDNAKRAATSLASVFSSEYGALAESLRSRQQGLLLTSGRERNEKCNAIQNVYNLITAIRATGLTNANCISLVENKISLVLNCDIFSGASPTPLFKKGESMIKVFNKINTMISDIDAAYTLNYEQWNAFKNFSKANVPAEKCTMHFSSSGEEGAWNIATSSMRGITSCQTWNAPQSRGLIGSITSRYVATIFIDGSGTCGPNGVYGKTMRHRCIARLVFNKITNKPAIFLDAMYPSFNKDVMDPIIATLKEKSGLDVMSFNEGNRDNVICNFYIPDEHSRSFLKEGEYSYMDSMIPIKGVKSPFVDAGKDIFEQRIGAWNQSVSASIIGSINKYMDYQSLLLRVVPKGNVTKINLLFGEVHTGPNAFKSMINFYNHCNKNHATSNRPAQYFFDTIIKSMGSVPNDIKSKDDVDLWLLKQVLSKRKEILDVSWAHLKDCSWGKSFKFSSKRFMERVFSDLKEQLKAAYKSKNKK